MNQSNVETVPEVEGPSPARLESFSDGVIAVILTIMVLDFKLPQRPGLASFVAAFFPTLAVYSLSFVFTGIYWINHHHLIHRLKRIDGLIIWTNLSLLFSLSLLPFATNYVLSQNFDSFSVAIYASELLLSSISFILLSVSITRHFKHTGVQTLVKAAVQRAEWRKAVLSSVMYTLAIPLAYWHPLIAAGDLALVTVLWVVPGFLLPNTLMASAR